MRLLESMGGQRKLSSGRNMITREQFLSLGAGDVLIWHPNPNNPYFRTVSEGPRDTGLQGIYLPIRSRSWTGKSFTCKAWNDVKNICTPSQIKRQSLFDPLELEKILKMGMKPKRDILHEMSENKRLSGWPLFHKCSLGLKLKASRALKALEFAEIP